MLVKDRAGALTDPQRNLVEQAEKSCARMTVLLAELSDVANLEAGTATFNRNAVALGPLLQEVGDALRGTGEQPLAVDVRGDVTASVHGDPVRLRMAFTGIGKAVSREQLSNPLLVIEESIVSDASGTAAIIFLGERAAVDAMRGAGLDGLGPFDELRGGCGLTLPAARRVIEAHGGEIRAPLGSAQRIAAAVRLPVPLAAGGTPR